MTIKFYLPRNPYGFFSNFSPHPIIVDDVFFHTAEHYFQWMKFPQCSSKQEEILKESNPKNMKRIAWDGKIKPRDDWDVIKDDVMRIALKTKFDTYPHLKKALLDTQDEDLVEDSPNDYYWGCGKDGSGKNRLGKLLMALRNEYCKV